MSAWYSNILNTTTTRIATIRTNLLSSDADGDTEDDTHVCRVLRGYYTEKGRQFPSWLPPDPKAPPPPVAQPVYAQSNVGSRYGGLSQGGGQQQQQGGLSSLWDSGPRGGQPQQAAPARASPFARTAAASNPRDDVQARPLPSQRAGSYQTGGGDRSSYGREGSGGSGAGSASDRLRNRLGRGGARTASPAQQSQFAPPAQQQGGSGGGDYEDRFAPGGMYDAPARGGGGGGDRPFMAANAPWATDEYEFSGGGGGGGGGRSGGGRRAGGGLPSGPRMR